MEGGRSIPRRVALCGNIANNAFNMARILRRLGHDARLCDDGMDVFPFSRPVWETRALTLSFEEVSTRLWRASDWGPIEARVGYFGDEAVEVPPPVGCLESGLIALRDLVRPRRVLSGLSAAARARMLDHRRVHARTVEWMAGFDVVVAFGYHAALAAWFSGRPTIYFTYGGDMRVQLADPNDADPVLAEILTHVLSDDLFVIDAYGCDREIHDILSARGLEGKSTYACLPNVDTELARRPRDRARLRAELGWPEDRLVFFMAARVDERWKRSSLFLEAFAAFAAERDRVSLALTGWGADFEAARARFTADQRLASRVTFLDECYSKPRLFDLYAAADVVVDQFAVGSLGSVSFEALCMGRPVLTHLAAFNFLSYPEPPPVINARTGAAVARALSECVDHSERLADVGARSAAWYRRVYAEENLDRAVDALARFGSRAWRSRATARPRGLPVAALPTPDGDGTVSIAPWPAACRAGLALLETGSHESLERSRERLSRLRELGVPVSGTARTNDGSPGAIVEFVGEGWIDALTDPDGRATESETFTRLADAGLPPTTWIDDRGIPPDAAEPPVSLFPRLMSKRHRTERVGLGLPSDESSGDHWGDALIVPDDRPTRFGIRHLVAPPPDFPDALERSGGGAVLLLPPFGTGKESAPALPAWLTETVERARAGRLWFRPLRGFLRYLDVMDRLRVDLDPGMGGGVILRLYARSGFLDEDALAGVHLILRGSFPIEALEIRDGRGAWSACRSASTRIEPDGTRLVFWPESGPLDI